MATASKAGRKAGRKQKHHMMSDGTQIKGLSRMSDGRWRIIGTQIRFAEPDEDRAVQRFKRLTKQQPTQEEIEAAGVYMPLHPGTLVGRKPPGAARSQS